MAHSYENVSIKNPALMIGSMFERRRELSNSRANNQIDPFFLLKEVVEMSRLDDPDNLTDEQKYNREQYNALVNQTFEEEKPKLIANGYDPMSIQEKMKNLRFAKMDNSKDSNWFSKMNSSQEHKPLP